MTDTQSLDLPGEISRTESPVTNKTHFLSNESGSTLCLKAPESDASALEIGGAMISAIMQHECHDALIIPPASVKDQLTDFLTGIKLGAYRFNKYYSNPKVVPPKAVQIADVYAINEHDAPSDAITSGTTLARDLVSEPSNTLSPEAFKDIIVKELRPLGVEVKILDEKEILKLGMNALHGVARGSRKPPFVVSMHWKGSDEKQPTAFIGKGVCFDTGGISLKPANGMHDMKYDMGGAAAVTGLLYTLAKRKAKANVVGIVGLVENMPDGNAQNPGDVVKSMSGKTIEVLNTDAEGRLVLADAITYSYQEFNPHTIIDLATLTGAIVVSLGNEYAGLFCNNAKLTQQLVDSGMKSHEKVWQQPLGKAYDKQINSDIADMQNIGKRWAGSITAAQFIQRFVKDETKWAHLDIAGVAWEESGKPHIPKGATGFGVQLLNHWVSKHLEA